MIRRRSSGFDSWYVVIDARARAANWMRIGNLPLTLVYFAFLCSFDGETVVMARRYRHSGSLAPKDRVA